MKVLIVEDSPKLLRSLEHGLTQLGWAVDVAADGDQAMVRLRCHDYELVVLDLMLPGVDGLEVLRRLRADGNDAHVLILSAKDQVEDRVKGLRLGADDYLTKPFAFEELEARLRSLVRRRDATKLTRIERHFDQVVDVHVVLGVEKQRQMVEATIHVAGNNIHAHSEHDDMYAAIDSLTDKLDRQVKKHKEKLNDHRS